MNTVKCPKCGSLVEITEVLKNEIRQESQEELEKELRLKIEEEKKTEFLDLQKALAEKSQKVDELREQELKLREEKRKIEEREKEMELEVGRKIDEAKKQIEEAVLKQAVEEHRLKDLEKEKKIADMEKLIEELKRKAQQGSMQTQGEVLELDLEELLRKAYPSDIIEPVEKGIRGADIRQIVKTQRGNTCGVILWEAKRTKAWQEEWLTKLKDDLRNEKANIPIIVTNVFPKGSAGGICSKDGVWLCDYNLIVPLADLIRTNLKDVAYQKYVSQNRGEKADLLYSYITGHEFTQQVEAIVEVYREMQEQITRERSAFEKSWKAREEQARRIITSSARIYGSVQGLVGSSMPQVTGLEILELEDGK